MEEIIEKGNFEYSKRPLWQWVVVYLIIGSIVYGVVYYLFLAKKGGYSYNRIQPNAQQQYITSTLTC
ncbi:hypothetical protein A2690_01665 [Candidatus Roizmanbacteria bacterium RIFCSPHIGHO2_01_FULL_39_12b]|uniref:Uncharacterized protein n=1 Tax=Candidatus Roizmanbacteria bacterium RIFCSPHIGHO2_01_FULL_39_12b TaxID=1802030 RepID=A0A1F7GB74_9BACT|nr:MAG: hypothetical protein A2690_01665 [Candidatus Roizmanbacteria bacterium RIFCSPHIGHO2_01_FULL_39_12b]OGK46129.1 MAG: hypothetical protein A3B46_02910 [Candidatus Roizmanbacteria bacterium RIFCSPLOWO2_01_FULL_39_19]